MKLKVLLKEDVTNLGRIGDVIDVAAGYARNYLLPKKIALPVNPGTMQAIEAARKRRAAIDAELKLDLEQVAGKIKGVTLTIKQRVSEAGTLYGSVSAVDIVTALAENGIQVEAKAVILSEHIKALGEYTVKLALHAEIETECKLIVAASDEVAVADDEDGADED